MTRTQNVKRNLVFNIVKYIAQIILQFVLRTAFIYTIGTEYLGLNGLFSNIFQFLNLAELGVGSAIVFAMYKPIAEKDIEKVKALQNLYKKFYLIIALVVLAIGGILTPFLNVFIKDTSEIPADINIYILFAMYLFNSVVGYLSAHKRSLLLAYERNDLENKIKTICLFAMSIIQIVILFVLKNYYIYFAANIVFTVVECIVVHIVSNKYFPEINGKAEPIDPQTKKDITKNVVALSMHKIGGAVVGATDNILISTFIGLGILGIYTNYNLILNSLILVFGLLTNALAGSVGNLIASSNIEHSYNKFKQINFIFSFLSAFCTICLLVLFQPFINIWTAKAEGGPLLLEFSTVIVLCVSFYLSRMRQSVQIFKDSAGLFWKDRWKPIIESLVNLGASIGLAFVMGIDGIFLGTIISTLVAPFWVEPYVLYKHYFKKSLWEYFRRYILDAIIMVTVGAICYYTCALIPNGGIWLLIAKFAVCIVLSAGFLTLFYCWTPEFKSLVNNFVKPVFRKIFKRKATKIESEKEILEETTQIKTEAELEVNKSSEVEENTTEIIKEKE